MISEEYTAPFVVQLAKPLQSIHLTSKLPVAPNHSFVLNSDGNLESMENVSFVNEEIQQPIEFQIVYPQDFNLTPNLCKRGRKKKKLVDTTPEPEDIIPDVKETKTLKVSRRTRSGRLVKLPKYIEKDFKKIEITSADEHDDFQVSDFKRSEEKENSTKTIFPTIETKKRIISSQYKCPKCQKAYLGKNKMIQHLKKYPDHGPLPEGIQEFNFDVWNHLFDITQKAKSGQKGTKFCEELSNLLHNVQLLKNALFKNEGADEKNSVQIDKVLGNAIGLAPGRYKFDENELYKDVTVLKLITNTDFFKPNREVEENSKSLEPPDADLLAENLLLPARNPVDDLILATVDNSSSLLDNSTSSDEVMNVDQFVNERFKKIIEPDIDLGGTTSLNLDLPSLDLFHFHTT